MISQFIVTADLHLRDSPYEDDLETSLKLLDDLGKLAKQERATHIVCCGDVFHSKNPSHKLMIGVYNKFRHWRDRGITFIWLRGNHDLQIKSQETLSIMTLYDEVCMSLIEPYLWENETQMFFFVPWYGNSFINHLRHYAKIAALHSNKQKVMFAHTGLREGRISEHFQGKGCVRAADFCEDLYDIILLGDYHMPQDVTDKIRYLGVPIPRNFADNKENYHPWLLSMTGKTRLEPLTLTNPYPKYRTHRMKNAGIIEAYSKFDKNRIVCSEQVAEELFSLYPDALYEYTQDVPKAESVTSTRLEGVDTEDKFAVWEEFCIVKHYSPHLKELGTEYLLGGERGICNGL